MNEEMFEKISDKEFLRFGRIPAENRPSKYMEVCAMLYLERRFPIEESASMFGGAAHDIVWLSSSVSIEDLTEEDAVYLARCGVHWDEADCLAIFA